MNSNDSTYYVYYLRRLDKKDFLSPELHQPFYVGKGKNGRISDHRREAEFIKPTQKNRTIKLLIIHKLWKSGFDFIEDIFLNNLTEKEAFIQECEAIKLYGRKDLGTGCLANMTDGGEGCTGLIHTEKTKQYWSEIRKGKPAWNKGLKNCQVITKETRKKLSDGLKGRVVSEETREKIRNSLMGHVVTKETKEKIARKASHPHPYKGLTGVFTHSEETKNKMSKAQTGIKRIKKVEEIKRKRRIVEKQKVA